MTIQQKYREVEKLFSETDWSNAESVSRYKKACAELRQMREEAEAELRNRKPNVLPVHYYGTI